MTNSFDGVEWANPGAQFGISQKRFRRGKVPHVLDLWNQTPVKRLGLGRGVLEAKMRTIGSKNPKARTGPMVRAHSKRAGGRANGLLLAAVLHDAIDDIEVGVEFWKTLGENRRAKLGHSAEFLNRGG